MKQGIVKFSKEFITPTGLKEWVGIEWPVDFENDNVMGAFNQAKKAVCDFQLASNVSNDLYVTQLSPSTEMPVINKAEERIGISIENSTTLDDLMTHKNQITTPYLADLFATKHQQLIMK